MKKLLVFSVMAVLLFGLDAVCSGACYYKITVNGNLSCHDHEDCESTLTCNYLSPDGGCAIYTMQDGSFVAVGEGLPDWSFGSSQSGLNAYFGTGDIDHCSLEGWGEEEIDDDFFDYSAEGPDSVTISISEIWTIMTHCWDLPLVCTGGFSVTIDRICTCEELIQVVRGCDFGDVEYDSVDCGCDGGLQGKADDKIAGETGEGDNGAPDTCSKQVTGLDPVILKTGAYVTSIADIHVPGRMMDINLVRTYKGDMNDPGFGYSYYV